jgi:membrane protein required for colicin V production
LVDLIIIVVLVTSALLGYWTGLVVQVLRLVSVLLSVSLALLYGKRLAFTIVGSEAVVRSSVFFFLCPLAIFMASLIVCYLLAYPLSALLKTTNLGPGDRVAGAVVAVFKGALVVGLFSLSSILLVSEGSPWRRRVAGSLLARGAAVGTYVLVWAMPEDAQQQAPGQGQLRWPVVATDARPPERAREGGGAQGSAGL